MKKKLRERSTGAFERFDYLRSIRSREDIQADPNIAAIDFFFKKKYLPGVEFTETTYSGRSKLYLPVDLKEQWGWFLGSPQGRYAYLTSLSEKQVKKSVTSGDLTLNMFFFKRTDLPDIEWSRHHNKSNEFIPLSLVPKYDEASEASERRTKRPNRFEQVYKYVKENLFEKHEPDAAELSHIIAHNAIRDARNPRVDKNEAGQRPRAKPKHVSELVKDIGEESLESAQASYDAASAVLARYKVTSSKAAARLVTLSNKNCKFRRVGVKKLQRLVDEGLADSYLHRMRPKPRDVTTPDMVLAKKMVKRYYGEDLAEDDLVRMAAACVENSAKGCAFSRLTVRQEQAINDLFNGKPPEQVPASHRRKKRDPSVSRRNNRKPKQSEPLKKHEKGKKGRKKPVVVVSDDEEEMNEEARQKPKAKAGAKSSKSKHKEVSDKELSQSKLIEILQTINAIVRSRNPQSITEQELDDLEEVFQQLVNPSPEVIKTIEYLYSVRIKGKKSSTSASRASAAPSAPRASQAHKAPPSAPSALSARGSQAHKAPPSAPKPPLAPSAASAPRAPHIRRIPVLNPQIQRMLDIHNTALKREPPSVSKEELDEFGRLFNETSNIQAGAASRARWFDTLTRIYNNERVFNKIKSPKAHPVAQAKEHQVVRDNPIDDQTKSKIKEMKRIYKEASGRKPRSITTDEFKLFLKLFDETNYIQRGLAEREKALVQLATLAASKPVVVSLFVPPRPVSPPVRAVSPPAASPVAREPPATREPSAPPRQLHKGFTNEVVDQLKQAARHKPYVPSKPVVEVQPASPKLEEHDRKFLKILYDTYVSLSKEDDDDMWDEYWSKWASQYNIAKEHNMVFPEFKTMNSYIENAADKTPRYLTMPPIMAKPEYLIKKPMSETEANILNQLKALNNIIFKQMSNPPHDFSTRNQWMGLYNQLSEEQQRKLEYDKKRMNRRTEPKTNKNAEKPKEKKELNKAKTPKAFPSATDKVETPQKDQKNVPLASPPGVTNKVTESLIVDKAKKSNKDEKKAPQADIAVKDSSLAKASPVKAAVGVGAKPQLNSLSNKLSQRKAAAPAATREPSATRELPAPKDLLEVGERLLRSLKQKEKDLEKWYQGQNKHPNDPEVKRLEELLKAKAMVENIVKYVQDHHMKNVPNIVSTFMENQPDSAWKRHYENLLMKLVMDNNPEIQSNASNTFGGAPKPKEKLTPEKLRGMTPAKRQALDIREFHRVVTENKMDDLMPELFINMMKMFQTNLALLDRNHELTKQAKTLDGMLNQIYPQKRK
jgi:hypothetical protein